MIAERVSPVWTTAAIVIAALVIFSITRAIWRDEFKKEAEKARWEMEHPLTIQAEQFPLSPPSDVKRWHYLEHSDSRGGGEFVMGLLFLAMLIFIVMTNPWPPYPIVAFLSVFFVGSGLLTYAGFMRLFKYRNLDMRITQNRLTPGDRTRIVIKQPGRRPIPHLQVALVNRLVDYGGEGTSYETLVVAPILELRNVVPAKDGRILDFEFEIPDGWPRTEDFPYFPIYSKIITEVRLKQIGPWPGCTYHYPVQIMEPAPSAIRLDWPLEHLRERIKREKKPARPAVTATLKAAMAFIVTTFVYLIITLAMPEEPSGLALVVWLLSFVGYVISVTLIPYKVWRRSYLEAKKE